MWDANDDLLARRLTRLEREQRWADLNDLLARWPWPQGERPDPDVAYAQLQVRIAFHEVGTTEGAR